MDFFKGLLIAFDAVRFMLRNEGIVRNKTTHNALGFRCTPPMQCLVCCSKPNTDAKFRLEIVIEFLGRNA